jgi:glucosamine-6-phosphate deaminase
MSGPDFDYALASFLPFRDREVCRRVRRITRERIADHHSSEFRISVVDDRSTFYLQFALDIVGRLRAALEADRKLVVIFPVGPMPQYAYAAELINRFRISCRHLISFNMDEYADEEGNTAPLSWPGSFQKAMIEGFFELIDPELRPPEEQIHFPTKEAIRDYGATIADLGGADVCYGGIGWGGHVAFWEPQLGEEFGDDVDSYLRQSARLVELHPMTIMQNALHSFGGDWSWVPPYANTIGPAEIVGAKERSFWLDGDLGGGVSWQRFIARLVAHGPVNTLVPGSILQLGSTSYTLLGGVADDVEIAMS